MSWRPNRGNTAYIEYLKQDDGRICIYLQPESCPHIRKPIKLGEADEDTVYFRTCDVLHRLYGYFYNSFTDIEGVRNELIPPVTLQEMELQGRYTRIAK